MKLTPLGQELVDREFPKFLQRDREMLAGLSVKEEAQLAALLRKVALTVEAAH